MVHWIRNTKPYMTNRMTATESNAISVLFHIFLNILMYYYGAGINPAHIHLLYTLVFVSVLWIFFLFRSVAHFDHCTVPCSIFPIPNALLQCIHSLTFFLLLCGAVCNVRTSIPFYVNRIWYRTICIRCFVLCCNSMLLE